MTSQVLLFIAAAAAVVRGAPLSGIARNVKSDLVLLNKLYSPAAVAAAPQKESHEHIPVGEALDLFYRYGFFSLSVRVVPRDDTGSWVIREPTISVFEKGQVDVVQEANHFENDFQIYFCDDETELAEAYFRDFTAEGIEEPHKLYTGSWHATTKAKYFGISKDAFDGDSSYVLVKLPKRRTTHRTGNALKLRPEAERAISAIQHGDPDSVLNFIKNYGSHFIQSVTVGDVVYQVFVLSSEQYASAKGSLLSHKGGGSLSHTDFATFHKEHLSSWLVKETGAVLAASGNRATLNFLESSLRDQGQFGSSPNIFKLQEDPALMQTLEDLTQGTEAVVALHFGSMRSWVPDIHAREYYDGAVDAQAVLWGANI
jgi:torso-like protein